MLTLPALRLTAEGKGRVIEEGISLDLSPNNKPSGSTVREPHQNGIISSAKANADEGLRSTANRVKPEVSKELKDVAAATDGEGSSLPTSNPNFATNSNPERTTPHIFRIHSMPLPSQLSQLQNPHRPSPLNPHYSSPQIPSVRSSRVDEVSVELADSIQLVIQTMLQISPPQVLDPAKEQFSACALSVPTSSMSAMFTAMKNINYISANMSSFCDSSHLEESSSSCESDTTHHNEFDVGELLQCLGDALSGAAAQAGVDLVIYHEDTGVKHVYVSGDESGISFALSHVRTSSSRRPSRLIFSLDCSPNLEYNRKG
jgi:osomolarity two-component system response regulator SSK1